VAKGIYKRGNIWWVTYSDLDGRNVRESSGSDKFKVAEALYLDRKDSVKKGKQPVIQKIANFSFNQLADKYTEWMQGRHRSADSKKYRIESMRSVFGNLPLRHFNTLIVEQYQTDLMNRDLKPASVNKNVSLLKAMFRKAVDWLMVEEAILKNAGKVKLLQENNRRLRYLGKDECRALIEACDSHLRPVVITALNSGMRRGEILGLKWENVDLKHGFILLEDKMTKNGERREIPINDTLRTVLQGLTRRLDVQHVFFDKVSGRPFLEVKRSFATALKKVETVRCPDCDFHKTRVKSKESVGNCPQCGERLAVTAGIQDFHFHDLRHTFASHLVMAGVDITTVKELLGHKTLTMTLRYAHLAPSHKVKAVDILDSTINGNSTSQLLHSLRVAGNV
jgi:integrase